MKPDDTEPTLVSFLARLMVLEADSAETVKAARANHSAAADIVARCERQALAITELLADMQPHHSNGHANTDDIPTQDELRRS